jgi:2-iminobutanoate/2-iminopropanoate deaminase
LIARKVLGLGLLLCAGVIAGCSSTGIGLPWIPQGPGGAAEPKGASREAPPANAPVAAAPRAPEPAPPGRKIDVSPDLIAQTAPPPRTPAEQAAAMEALKASGPSAYTQATRYGDLVFVSGQIALDGGTNQIRGTSIEEQTRQVMENLRAILEAHRLNMANVVSVTVYLTSLNDFRGMNHVYESYFRGGLPSRSVVEVVRLPRGALIEISLVAGK